VNREELGKLYPVVLSESSDEWPLLFAAQNEKLLHIFDQPLRVEHIGSTAIPGILAKPTIDILMEKPDMPDAVIISKMNKHGFIHMKEQLRHLMFVKGYSASGLERESYHIHMGPLSLDFVWDRVFFRDFLIQNPEESRNYEKLKIRLAETFKFDRESYTENKTEYILRITRIAKEQALNRITSE
jgi:GrpB-like predicted nucleotidyltransferase (UPF0157 family)